MHKHAIEVSRLHRANLNGLLPPTHDLVGVDVGCRRAQTHTHIQFCFHQFSNDLLSENIKVIKDRKKHVDGSHTYGGGHLTPLQHNVFSDAAISVDIHTLILIAQQHLHAIRLRQNYNSVWGHLTLNLQQPREGEEAVLYMVYVNYF